MQRSKSTNVEFSVEERSRLYIAASSVRRAIFKLSLYNAHVNPRTLARRSASLPLALRRLIPHRRTEPSQRAVNSRFQFTHLLYTDSPVRLIAQERVALLQDTLAAVLQVDGVRVEETFRGDDHDLWSGAIAVIRREGRIGESQEGGGVQRLLGERTRRREERTKLTCSTRPRS